MHLPAVHEEFRDDAADLLDHVPFWELTPEGWGRAENAVLAIAAAGDDTEALRDAVASLDVLDPRRGTKAGTEPEVPIPKRVRETVTETKDKLGH
ncbi:CATRA system-associated protein [Parafrankia elaeagni]|uniref:CATRA system-associated protein n=1 Tax=Parafrankia elaeagni TaxID=222534 RepID=UPI0003772A3F|nr:CATRA system-associated protein [Parafrankia elaeagni]